MLKRILSIVMCLVLMCGMTIVVSAESSENQVQPRYSYTNTISATLRDSNGKALCGGDVNGYRGTTTKIILTVTLQKRTLLLFWNTEKEWTTTVNDFMATISKTVAVDSGTYRVKVEAKVYSGSNYENVDCTSPTREF